MTTHLDVTDPVDLVAVAESFGVRARAAGHPILHTAPGRWPDHATPAREPSVGEVTPNDLLDTSRRTASARIAWVHVVLPTIGDAVTLTAALHPAPSHVPAPSEDPDAPHGPGPCTGRPPTGQGWRGLLRRAGDRPTVGGEPRRVPFPTLVDQAPVSAATVTVVGRGTMIHLVEVPADRAADAFPAAGVTS